MVQSYELKLPKATESFFPQGTKEVLTYTGFSDIVVTGHIFYK